VPSPLLLCNHSSPEWDVSGQLSAFSYQLSVGKRNGGELGKSFLPMTTTLSRHIVIAVIERLIAES
jgi:hypothetical protein